MSLPKAPIENRPWALITGTSGIGAASAQRLSSAYDLFLVFRENQARAEELVASLSRRNPTGRFEAMSWNLNSMKQGSELCEKAIKAMGEAPAALILAHGRKPLDLFFQSELSEDEMMVQEHLLSAMGICKVAVKSMAKARMGRIVFVSSIASFNHRPGRAVYGAAKAGLVALAKGLAQECARFGVTVNCVAPGATLTSRLTAQEQSLAIADTPIGRLIEADEVAQAIEFFVRGPGCVTGANLVMDGGLSLGRI